MGATRQNGNIILHSDDGTGIRMIFKNLTGRNFQGQEYGVYPACRNRGHGILARYHRALQGQRDNRQRGNPECMAKENPMKLAASSDFLLSVTSHVTGCTAT